MGKFDVGRGHDMDRYVCSMYDVLTGRVRIPHSHAVSSHLLRPLLWDALAPDECLGRVVRQDAEKAHGLHSLE